MVGFHWKCNATKLCPIERKEKKRWNVIQTPNHIPSDPPIFFAAAAVAARLYSSFSTHRYRIPFAEHITSALIHKLL